MSNGQAGRAAEQIEAIRSLDETLAAGRIDYWLFGGWAVDFWVGRVTRSHDDIDALALREDYEAIATALGAAGWRHTPVENEVVGTRYSWLNCEVEFTFVAPRADGAILIPIPDHEIVLTSDPLGGHRRTLHGVSARVIPLELLRSGKQHAREPANEGGKDVADLAALMEM